MDLFELARTVQHERERSMEQTVRLRRLLVRRTDLPGLAADSRDGRAGDRSLPQVAVRPGSPR